MALFELVAITERAENEYVYHVRVPFGSKNYIVQYTKNILNSGSINLKCVNRRDTKVSQLFKLFMLKFCSVYFTLQSEADPVLQRGLTAIHKNQENEQKWPV